MRGITIDGFNSIAIYCFESHVTVTDSVIKNSD